MPEEGLLDAPVDEVEVDVADTGESTADEAELGDKDGERTADAEVEGESDGKMPLWKEAKAALAKIKEENPTLAAKMKAALIRAGRPDPSTAALQTAVAALGDPTNPGQAPEQILAAVQQEIGGWRDFDQKFTSADPALIEEIASASPESFQRLIPMAMDKLAAVNPDGYSSYISKVLVSDMHNSEIPVKFAILKAFLPQLADGPAKDQVIAAVEALYGWTNKFGELAKKPVAPDGTPKAPTDDITTQQQQLQTQQVDLRRQQWNTTSSRFGHNLIATEAKKIAGNAALNEQQMQKVTKYVGEELDARLAKDGKYGEAMRGYLQNNNAEGYRRRLHSEYSKLIPGAVRRAVDDLQLKQKPGPKPGTVKSAPAAKPLAGKPEDGFTRLAQSPTKMGYEIDFKNTPRGWVAQGKAILKGSGKKVQWSTRAISA